MDQQPSTSSLPSMDSQTSNGLEKRHLYVSELLIKWNLGKLFRRLGTRDQCLAFAEEQGLILSSKMCRRHRSPMRLDFKMSHVGGFICNKGVCRGKNKISRAKGTWFENVKITLPQVFYLMYAYAYRFSYDMAIHEDFTKEDSQQCLSRATIRDWYSYCREAVVIFQLHRQENKGKIGGPGVVVQINKKKFGKGKYGNHIGEHWVLGLIEDGSEELRLEVCPNNIRSADVLIPLIIKHVETGSIIHMDCWKEYDCLSEYGYIHRKVDHNDPNNSLAEGGTHTQRIISQWRVVKRFFQKDNCFHSENFADFIVEYLWRRDMDKEKRDPYLELIKAIKHVHKI